MIIKNRQGLFIWLLILVACLVTAAGLVFAASNPINLSHTASQINQAHTMSLDLRAFTGIPRLDGQGGLRVGTFTDLSDTPSSYSGAAGWLVQVNGTEDGLELVAMDPLLVAISGLTTGADEGLYFTGVDTVATFPLTPFARTILDDADAATVRATIGAQAASFNLNQVAAGAVDSIIYYDWSGAAQTLTLGASGTTLMSNGPGVAPSFVAAPWAQSITKDSPTSATYRWFRADAALTVTGFDVILAAGDTGTIPVDVQKCTSTGTSCVSILSAPVTATATGASATITDTNIAADAWVQIFYGTPSGIVSQVAVTLKGTR